MCRNYREIEFTHFVVTAEGSIFGSARDNGHIHNFLIEERSVREQAGNDWCELEPALAELVKERAQQAYGTTPIFRTRRIIYD